MGGFVQKHILGYLERDFDRLHWDMYRKTPDAPTERNDGPALTPHGPNMTTRERRLRAPNSPWIPTGGGSIFRGFDSHFWPSKDCLYTLRRWRAKYIYQLWYPDHATENLLVKTWGVGKKNGHVKYSG